MVSGTPLPLFDGIQSVVTHHSIDELTEQQVHTKIESELSKAEQKNILAKQIKELVGNYHRKTGEPYPAIHARLNKIQKVKSQLVCSLSQLEDRIGILEKLVRP